MDQEPALTSARLVVLERNRVIDALLLAAIPLGVLLFASFLLWRFLPGTFGVHISVIAAAVRFGMARENSRPSPVERTVQVSAEGVRSDDKFIPRKDIAEGFYQPRTEGQSSVRLYDRHKRVAFEARVDTEAQAQAMLRALGLDASQKRTQFRIPSPFAESQFRMMGLMMALGIAGSSLAAAFHLHVGSFAFFLPIALGGIIALMPRKLTVGIDGILSHWLLWKKFTPMSSIVEAYPDGEREIRLKLASGKEETIAVASPKRRGGVYTERRNLILARIRESARAHHALGPRADIATVVARGERSIEEWKEALASLDKGEAGYREAAIREEDLWRVVEDPRAGEDARAGAAVLLRKGLDESGRARVRIAAEATASPKLRIALEAATGEDDDAALEALDEVEAKPLRVGAF